MPRSLQASPGLCPGEGSGSADLPSAAAAALRQLLCPPQLSEMLWKSFKLRLGLSLRGPRESALLLSLLLVRSSPVAQPGVPAPGWCPGHRQAPCVAISSLGPRGDAESVCRAAQAWGGREAGVGRFYAGLAAEGGAFGACGAERLLCVLPSGFLAPAAPGTAMMPSPSCRRGHTRGGGETDPACPHVPCTQDRELGCWRRPSERASIPKDQPAALQEGQGAVLAC